MSTLPAPHPVRWAALACRVIIGGLFIFAAYMKLGDPQGFADAIVKFDLFPKTDHPAAFDHIITLLTFVIPWTEIVTGMLLIVGLCTRAAALLVSLMLVGFIVGIASVLVRGMDVHCSCFGKFEWPCTGPIGACQLTRDAIMLAMTLLVFAKGPGPLSLDRCHTH